MNIFWWEFIYFIVAAFAILVSISAASLFYLVIIYERQLKTVWRAVGFSALSIAFLLFILERKFPSVEFGALIVQAIGFIGIYLGVFAEPKLSQLAHVGLGKKSQQAKQHTAGTINYQQIISSKSKVSSPIQVFSIALVIGLVAFIVPALRPYFASTLQAVASLFILATMPIQIKRYQREKDNPFAKRQNLYPLLGYIFLLIGSLALIVYRLPDLNLVSLRLAGQEYGYVWQMGILSLFIGFTFLAIWAWNFIKVRPFLRSYVLFSTIAIAVSTLGAFVFTLQIFTTVEQNNFNLLSGGARTELLITEERKNNALNTARLLAENTNFIGQYRENEISALRKEGLEQLKISGTNLIRVYDAQGKIILNVPDDRRENEVITKDEFLDFVISKKQAVSTFDTEKRILAPRIIARALYPILDENNLIGVVEAGSVFDTAFVDYSKNYTGFDVTIFSGTKRSATTISTDGSSRWVGSELIEQDIAKKVFQSGERVARQVNRLGVEYYKAYEPVRNINGKIIGIVAVGTPIEILLEETRQRLLTSFLIVTGVSLALALAGYAAVKSFK